MSKKQDKSQILNATKFFLIKNKLIESDPDLKYTIGTVKEFCELNRVEGSMSDKAIYLKENLDSYKKYIKLKVQNQKDN